MMTILAAAGMLATAAPAVAKADAPVNTRLVHCSEDDCLLITGRRDDRASTVRINGHVVEVEGQRRWRVRLPVETVRAWSAPYARTIAVAVTDGQGDAAVVAQADLPIGLLGQATRLASLVISVR